MKKNPQKTFSSKQKEIQTCKIGYITYTINYVPKLLFKKTYLRGLIDTTKSCITLARDQSQEGSNQTLLHEALHGIGEVYNLDMDEDHTDKLATALLIFMKDNPVLIENLIGGSNKKVLYSVPKNRKNKRRKK